jgi:hypothetical protein
VLKKTIDSLKDTILINSGYADVEVGDDSFQATLLEYIDATQLVLQTAAPTSMKHR